MRLLWVEIISAATCGGLLDGFSVQLKGRFSDLSQFSPVCLIGPNGAGKSQFLQVVAEIFMTAFHSCVPDQERREGNPSLLFSLEYLIYPKKKGSPLHVRIARRPEGGRRPELKIEVQQGGLWVACPLRSNATAALLPSKIVGYTSGDNETLSLPFLISRSGYAEEVGRIALAENPDPSGVQDTRLMLIDYGTHLEVMVANLLLGSLAQRTALLHEAHLRDIHSFRCVVQLAHNAVPQAPARRAVPGSRKGVQLTAELEQYIDRLARCCTCHSFDPKSERYTFDFRVTEATREAFHSFFETSLELYTALHKLAMLNDLAIPRGARELFRQDKRSRRFASRLPEPQEEDKVFRFELVKFVGQGKGEPVDYVSLSDGEHQLVQLLGTFCMLSFGNVLFLLDEPESHFNPQWRVKFLSRLRELPTGHGRRNDQRAEVAQQECVLTTHAPFVPSDMSRDHVFIFGKEGKQITARLPDIETYGTTFDSILEECFGVRPPMSELPKVEIAALMQSEDAEEIQSGLERLGDSVEKVFLADRLREIKKKVGRK